MSTFALDASDSTASIVDGLNYALANLDTNNPYIAANVLTANITTGEITTTSTNAGGYSSTTIVNYLYQYMTVKYANSATGSTGFTSNSTLSNYYGLRNTSNNTVISNNPTDYVWYQVTGGFGTTKNLWYETTGGRQVVFFAGNAGPAASFIPVPDNTILNLDSITSVQNNQIVNVNAFFQSNITPGTPAGGTYDFNTFTLYPPVGWSANIPGFVANTDIFISQNVFVGNTVANVGPARNWTTPAVYTSQFNGNTGAPGARGFVPLGFVVTATDPTTYTNSDYTTAFTASRSNSSPPIGLGYAPIAGDTAQFFYANLFNRNNDVTTVRSFDGNTWSSVDAQVVSGDIIYPGTITANAISVNSVYAITIQSTNAELGNISSPGYWLEANTGSARFAGNTSIGNNLTIGANATIGGNVTIGDNLTVSNLITAGTINGNTVTTTMLVENSATQTISASDNASYPTINFVNGTTNNPTQPGYLWPFFTRGFAIGGGATITTTTNGSITGSKITVNYNAYINSATQPNYNVVELWKSGASKFYSKTFRVVRPVVVSGNVDYFTIPGNNGALYRGNIGNIVSYATSTSNDLLDGTTGTTSGSDAIWSWGTSGQFVNFTNPSTLSYSGNIGARQTALGGSGSAFPLFNMYGVSQLGSDSTPRVLLPTVIVGSGGTIAFWVGGSTLYSLPLWAFESSGTFANLNDVSADVPNNRLFNTVGQTTNYAVVGTGGTILYNTRTYNSTGNIATTSGWNQAVSGTTQQLNAIHCNYTQASYNGASKGVRGNLWVAVGDQGTIISSPNNSGPWTAANSVPVTVNLHGVGYTNGNWVAVGDSGTILFSSDASNWTSLANPADGSGGFGVRNLYGVGGGLINHTFVVAGEELIISATTPNISANTTWANVYYGGESLNSDLTRVQYFGSNANVAITSLPPATQQVQNAQTISSTYIDTDYTAGQTITYYLVVGNMFGNVVITTKNPNLTVTEFKR